MYNMLTVIDTSSDNAVIASHYVDGAQESDAGIKDKYYEYTIYGQYRK